jgi:SAM-dependent methyltransferase
MAEDAKTGVDEAVQAGQAVYTRLVLRVYDPVTFGFNFPVLWRCPKGNLQRLYDEHAGGRHLDIGVGSGYLIDRCRFPVDLPRITLMDLNPNSLGFAARRLRRYSPEVHRANVLEAWGLPGQGFDSVAMVNLLHCVPGTLPDKAVAFEHAYGALAPGGTLFGATVLGLEADHTRRSRRVLERYNSRRVFSNLEDRREDLEAGLGATFDVHEVDVRGAVALFVAHKHRQTREESE